MKKFYLAVFVILVQCVSAQIINIPDTNFKTFLLTQIIVDSNSDGFPDTDADVNNDGEVDQQEALSIRLLWMDSAGISSLTGLEYFYNLEDLRFSYNQVTSVDLHTLGNLRNIHCFDNQLTEIDLCGTVAEVLWCSDNAGLTYISVKNNVISSATISRSLNGPPPLPSFIFENLPMLQTICYDQGEYAAIDPWLAPAISTTTNCECPLLETETFSSLQTITIYPNPVLDALKIETNGASAIHSVNIYNALGQMVSSQTNPEAPNFMEIETANLTPGIYFVEVATLKRKSIQKLLKL